MAPKHQKNKRKGGKTQEEKRSLREYRFGFLKTLTRNFKKEIKTKGTHSSFYEARLQNKRHKDLHLQKLIVKAQKEQSQSFEREKEVLEKASGVRIVKAFGYAIDGDTGYLIFERRHRNLTSAIPGRNYVLRRDINCNENNFL